MLESYHEAIMPEEAVDFLSCRDGGVYVDCTIGGGGHSMAILEASSPEGKLIGVDRDKEALAASEKFLERYASRLTLAHGNFRELGHVLASEGIAEVDGIMADLGVSSRQLDEPMRGFSFLREGPLDMRMDQSEGETASDLIGRLTAVELESILKQFGEERWSRRIAESIKAAGAIKTTLELAAIVDKAVPKRFHPRNVHVATRTFQALRIAVNEELKGLGEWITSAASLLKEGGRIVIISFHSLEDRVVKQTFRSLSSACVCPPDLPYCKCGRKALLTVITRKPVIPSPGEIERNPRARSARMRVAERV